MAKLSYAQKQRLNRRTADITKLQSQYARSVEDYTASVGTKETAFKAEMDKYNAAYEPYQQKATAYQTRLANYQNALAAFQAKPNEQYTTRYGYRYIPRINAYGSGEIVKYSGSQYGPPSVSGPFVGSYVNDGSGRGQTAFTLKEGYTFDGAGTIYGKTGNPGAFTEKFTEQAPVAPAALDIKAEQTKLQGEKDYTSREIDERSKSRLRAVQRGNSRPMLSAGTNLNKVE